MKKVYLLNGGNLGDRIGTLKAAERLIGERIGPVVSRSSYYETEAWGNVDQPDYVNQALAVETQLDPQELLKSTQQIEIELGRVRRSKWESRPIDIDILFYGSEIINSKKLTVPHPHLHRRNFVLIPLLEIAPELWHPVLEATIEDLYLRSTDELDVIQLESQNLPA